MSSLKDLLILSSGLPTVLMVCSIRQGLLTQYLAGRIRAHGPALVKRMAEDLLIVLFAGVKLCTEATCGGLLEAAMGGDMRTVSRLGAGCETTIGNVLRTTV